MGIHISDGFSPIANNYVDCDVPLFEWRNSVAERRVEQQRR